MSNFPKLSDVKKEIPPGGLLNPGLRSVKPNIKGVRPMRTPTCGNFKNVLGR